MELRSRGWSIVAAAREAGVSRSTGKNWSRGCKIYWHGVVTGFMPVRRNATAGCCRPFEAHRRATARRARHHRRRVETSEPLRQLVADLLDQRWARSRSAASCGDGSRTSRRCGCVTRAFTRPSTSLDRR